MDPTLVTNLFGAIGLGAATGLNPWIPLFGLGLATRLGVVELSSSFDRLGSTPVLHLIGFVIAPVSGAIVVAAQDNLVSNTHPGVAAVIGLTLGGVVHASRSTIRPAVTASTAGFGNPVISTVEDVVSTVLTVLAVLVPVIAFLVLVGLVVAVVVSVRRWRRRRADGAALRAAPPPAA